MAMFVGGTPDTRWLNDHVVNDTCKRRGYGLVEGLSDGPTETVNMVSQILVLTSRDEEIREQDKNKDGFRRRFLDPRRLLQL